MKNLFEKEIEVAINHNDKGIGFNYLIAIQRCMLQTAAISTIDYFCQIINEDDGINLNDLMLQMHSPVDSTPIVVLDTLVPIVRQTEWPSYIRGWFERPHVTENTLIDQPLAQALQKWLVFRNSKPGHGVLDEETVNQNIDWLVSLAKQSLTSLSSALPKIEGNDSNSLYLDTPCGKYTINSPLLHDGQPIVIRRLRNRRGVWSLKYQPLNIKSSKELEVRIANDAPILGLTNELKHTFVIRKVFLANETWHPLIYMPNRETVVFEGRDEEIDQLKSWVNDAESRACLVFGDGGIGKTTLVLEFLHNYLDGLYPSEDYRPDIICFYTAKLTKWTENGVVHFKGLSPVIADAIRQLVLSIQDRLDPKWYSDDTRALIDKASGVFNELGVNRKKILLILDNTETLSRKPSEEKELTDLITQISAKLSRVIVTSRRREKIEARPIEVPPMDEETGAELLRQLAEEYNAKPLIDAGDARLRRQSRELSGKPLLLNVLARFIGRTGLSIDDGMKRVLQDAREGLSEFLYDDVWQRISIEQKHAFVILASLDLPLNNIVVGWVCGELKLPHTTWLNAFHETYFGRLTEYGTDYDIELEQMAIAYFEVKKSSLPKSERDSIDKIISTICRRHKELEKAESTSVSDRVGIAFKTGAARAAKLAVARGDYDEAHEWYLEAIKIDADNTYLLDRFAWFLMNYKRDFQEAIQIASQACRIDPSNSDAHFTLGLSYYRSHNINSGDAAMLDAQKNGKPDYLCAIQKARARIELAKRKEKIDERSALIDEAERLLNNAKAMIPSNDYYSYKNTKTCERNLKWIERDRKQSGRYKRAAYLAPTDS